VRRSVSTPSIAKEPLPQVIDGNHNWSGFETHAAECAELMAGARLRQRL